MDQYDCYPEPAHPQNSENTHRHKRHKRPRRSFATPLSPTIDVATPDQRQEFVNEEGGLQSANADTWTREPRAQHRSDVFRSPSYRPPETPSVVALERLQGSRNPTANDRIENTNSNQYDRPPPSMSPTTWSATQGARSSSANVNSFSEAQPQWSIDEGSNPDLDDHEAYLDQFKKSRSAQMMFDSARQALYNRRSPQARVRNAARSQLHHAAVPDKSVAISSVMSREPAIADAGTRGSHTQLQVRDASHSQLSHAGVLAKADTTPDVLQSSAFFQNAHGFNVSGNPSFQNQNIGSVTNVYRGTKDDLESLKGSVSFEAQFDSSAQDPDRQCHPGTRQNVLKRLRDWVDNPNSIERIFWLYGPAGAGKSAIAQTIARSYPQSKVAATFFFFRSDVNRNNGNRLFTTLAYQLAFSMPALRDHIAHSLSKRPDLPTTDIETQFNQLIARPFYVLNDDATQQLAPAVHIIIDIVKKYRELAPVIIIDGVDECIDEKLQQRLLKVIGDTVKDDCFPLRFLIVSRPEVHIEQTIRRRFQNPILIIDLADLDDANRDIEKYLVDEFSRIASEKGLDPAWPGPKIIRDIVYKSSGNFIYASVVIKFVGDPYCFAKTQLEIVLNMKPPKTMSPFAVLDQLFLEILGRVPDQEFLKRYLALLVARISVPNNYGRLYRDDAVLMHVSEEELLANLLRMRSLLKFEPVIDVHHKSFLDFLHDSSRSNEYYIRPRSGIRGYLEVFVDSLVRYVSTVIEQPNHHNATHFAPRFRTIITSHPLKIELPVEVWQEVAQPLLDLQNTLLKLPNFISARDFLPCDQCTIFPLLRELIHLRLRLGFTAAPSAKSVKDLRKRTSLIATKTGKNMDMNALDGMLQSLFAYLPETMENCYPNERVMNLMNTILCFDYSETVRRVRSVSDAQKLVDLLDYMIHTKNALQADAKRKASLLALEIFARVPIMPLSYFLNGNDGPYQYILTLGDIGIEIWSQTIFAHRILDRRYIAPALWIKEQNLRASAHENYMTMYDWRRASIPSSVTTTQIMLRLAKAIEYLHSMGVVLYHQFRSHHVLLDSDLCPKIRCLYSTSPSLLDNESGALCFSLEDNVLSFGCLLYEIYSGVDIWSDHSIRLRNCVIPERPSGVPENAWQLIQRCCAEDPVCRPTINEIVKEIEGWHRPGCVESIQTWTCFGALCSVFSGLGRSLRQ